MTRDEYIEALLPGVRQSIIHFVGQEKERRARAMLDQYATSELAMMFSKQVANGTIRPPSPPTPPNLENARVQGETELETLREQHRERMSAQRAERDADRILFQRQQDLDREPQRKLEAEASLARDRAAFDEAAKVLKIGNNQANFNLCRSVLGQGSVTVYGIREAISSNAISLSPMTVEEEQELQAELIEAHNKRLLSMNPIDLKKEIKREAIANRAASSQREENQMLEEMRLRDAQMNLPPLPAVDQNGKTIDANYLKVLCNSDLPKYKHWLRRFGGYQLTLRLQGRA